MLARSAVDTRRRSAQRQGERPWPPSPDAGATLAYDERLTALKAWRAIAALFGISVALIFLPYRLIAGFIALLVSTCVPGGFVSAQGSQRIRVTSDVLIAGDARIPLTVLGEPDVLQDEEARARAWRTYRVDLRAFTLSRRFSSSTVRVEVLDPDGSTPYLYLSTAHRSARSSPRFAHLPRAAGPARLHRFRDRTCDG
ncbi:DUF3093 family protein [Streptomyces sp. NPDC056002]|uniref:DUF3093 family protein n=1 Tax=unclassified Streptomyces TaxID=2593676 RepID=UPI0035DFCE60